MLIAHIYKLTCLINGKAYVGFTTQEIQERLEQHRRASKKDDTALYHAINKHGWTNFVSEILYSSLNVEQTLHEMEPFFIEKYDTYKSGYNSTKGGDGVLGLRHSESTKQLLRDQKLGKPANLPESWHKEHQQKMVGNHYRKGKVFTFEQLQKISDGLKALHGSNIYERTPEIRKKLADSKSKTWEIFYPDQTVQIILNLRQFCRDNKLDHAHMQQVADGIAKQHKGYCCKRVSDG